MLAWQLLLRHSQILHSSLRYYCLLITLHKSLNIVVFVQIDQSVGASADELSAIIYWHSGSIPIVFVIVRIGQILMKRFAIVYYVLSVVAVSAVIISNSLLKKWLDTTPHKINPVKLVAKVLNYAIKNKYPSNRSA